MNREEVKQQLLENIDFQQIQNHMAFVNWTYYDGPPTIERLRETAELVLNDVLDSVGKESRCSTGGFHAFKWAMETGTEYELIFALDWSSTS